MKISKNPILSGFYPDPSVCCVKQSDKDGRVVDADYYLVNSSFAYVPGVPIFHSKNLQDWTQIGHVLERPEQFVLTDAGISEGIYAPTIRYDNGTFYMITTNVSDKGNFYVTSASPRGPWSNPHCLPDAEGIDPSLYFEAGHCYYIGQRTKQNAKYFGDCEIWLQELDLKQEKLIGEVFVLWDGAMKHAVWPEGPHLYKRGAYYYLITAEGGTAYSHSICAARSKTLTGPYEGCPNNPIFTHRNLGCGAAIQNVGHADFVEAPNGEWYAVMLATRPMEGCAPLGRESFLAKVVWEEDWPVLNPGVGMLTEGAKEEIKKDAPETVIEWKEPLDMRCLFYGHPERELYRMERLGEETLLALQTCGLDISAKQSPAYLGVRVTKKNFSFKTTMRYCPEKGEEAGLVYLYDEKNYVKFVMTKEGGRRLSVKMTENGKERTLVLVPVPESRCRNGEEEQRCELLLELSGLYLSCWANGQIIAKADVHALTTERAGGFVGCTMGVYAGGGRKAGNYARFSKVVLG